MAKILINDGIHPTGEKMLRDAGHEVSTETIAQADLIAQLPRFDAICVRSATKVRTDLIDACPNLKAICRGGVGLDNIDVDHAKSKGVAVINTPAASSRSVAELAFSHLFSIARSLYLSNRAMPSKGATEFKSLKKSYSKGFELYGRTLGVIGLGRIGQETTQLALSVGMRVLAVDPFVEEVELTIGGPDANMKHTVKTVSMDEMLSKADVVTLHVPFLGKPVLSTEEFSKMKDGVVLINCSRGGTVDEDAMLAALESGKLAAAGVDVFINEPTPRTDILEHPRVSLTPHTGASTVEAQEKIGIELAEKLMAHLGS
ncbi:MAG: D-3-phosphoglycerate dehydrogenase [Saprospiraceae bacterium]|jgi:D-3-phosphoglycerate dehydrogenase